ncbi:MAG TPA: 5-formyltetrahydrofolate cyclo-ligase [Actinomycetota bacterium]|nr:5-formyltetrahydrofolate cyclo-ligase [Actinomycetota bacterium]
MSVSDELKRRKRALRARMRAARDAASEAERAGWSGEIARRLLGLAEVRDARTVMAFSSFGSEVDTRPVLERLLADGCAVALPRVEGGRIVPVELRPDARLRPASFGALEPEGDPLAPEAVDAVIVPGLAFDRRGYRVGYGGGFYDRFLPLLRAGAPRVGVCFSLQLVEEVPHGPADVPVELVVTQDEVIRCR